MPPPTAKSAAPPPIAVTGCRGMLGQDMVAELKSRGLPAIALTRAQCDITSPDSCREALRQYSPDVVINCAAYTKVDQAESEPDIAMAINGDGPANLARACAALNIYLVHISTDYVFDGTGDNPRKPDDPVAPINTYGRTKLAGETAIQKHLSPEQYTIARTSWLYGAHGPNFVRTMLRLAGEKRDLKIIDDQVGSPTYTKDLTVALADIALRRPGEILHTTGGGHCTWFQFAQEIFNLSGIHPASLTACATVDYPTPAARPANSRLCCQNLLDAGLNPLPHWQDALRRYLAETGALAA